MTAVAQLNDCENSTRPGKNHVSARVLAVFIGSLLVMATIVASYKTGYTKHASNDSLLQSVLDDPVAKAAAFGLAAVKKADQVIKHSSLNPLPNEVSRQKHILDWNWRPEMSRDQSVPNWVGRNWVAHSRGTTAMVPIKWERYVAHPVDVEGSAKDGSVNLSTPAHSASSNVIDEIQPRAAQMQLPSLSPLKYFPSVGKPIFNTDYILQQAHKYISRLKSTSSESVPQQEVSHPAVEQTVSVDRGNPTAHDHGGDRIKNAVEHDGAVIGDQDKVEQGEGEDISSKVDSSSELSDVEKRLTALQLRLRQLEKKQ